MAKGDDVRRWRIEDRDRWLIFTRRGTNIENYPAIKAHLEQWKAELTPKAKGATIGRKPGRYKWFEIQDDIAYFAKFDKPKIVYPEIAKEPRFAFDNKNVFVNNKAFIVPCEDLFLLGVLNSSSAWEAAKKVCSVLGNEEKGGRLMLQWVNFQQLPIPNASGADQSAIASLVEACLSRRGQGCEAEEAEINARVAALYGLDEA